MKLNYLPQLHVNRKSGVTIAKGQAAIITQKALLLFVREVIYLQ